MKIQKILSLIIMLWAFMVSPFLFAKEVNLKQKIGQMIMIGFKGAQIKTDNPIVKAIQNQAIGGVVLYDYNVEDKNFHHNIESPLQLKTLTHDLQNLAKTAAKNNENELNILLIGLDYEGGKVTRLKEDKGFPKTFPAVEIAQLPVDEAYAQAQQMAATLADAGVNFNFAPVVDVNVNPDSPAIGHFGRSFSSDPQEVIKYAALFSKAYRERGIVCAYKHFPGHGSATKDSHLGFVDVTQTWQSYELEPFFTLLARDNACGAVMTAHVVHYGLDSKGYPATLSSQMLTEVLRKRAPGDYVIITDDMQMKAITDNFGLREAIRMSINAGADILLFSNQDIAQQDAQELVDYIYDDVMTGKIRVSRIDDAYQHIVHLKAKLAPR